MAVDSVKRNFIQKIFGIPKTRNPAAVDCWEYDQGNLIIDLCQAPELMNPGGAIRIEGRALPVPVLVVHGDDREYRAYRNQCTHFGHRRLDPVPGTNTIQCCSVNKSSFDCCGQNVSGPAKHSVDCYPVEKIRDKLFVVLADR